MKRIFFGLVSLLFLTFAACGAKEIPQNTGPYGGSDGLDLFLKEVQPDAEDWTTEERREIKTYLQPETFEHVFTLEEIQELKEERKSVRSLSAEQAAEDVTLAFQLLSYGYSGYDYFGGDEVFLPIRDSILDKLSSMDKIKTSELRSLLWDNLSPVIIDMHFLIKTSSLIPYNFKREYAQHTYYVPDLYFDDPTGIDSQYVKHTIGPEGAITYCLATVCKSPDDLPNKLTIEGKERSLKWKMAQYVSIFPDQKEVVYSQTTVAAEQLPVLRNYTLIGDQEKLDAFAATGASYLKAPQLVVDLRGNSGGYDTYAYTWLKNYSFITPETKRMFAHKRSNLHYIRYTEPDTDSTGDWELAAIMNEVRWLKDKYLFVLVDNNTASAGEAFARLLSLGNHVVLVGCNTKGCSAFGNVASYYLPNSGIELYFGSSLAFHDTFENTEGIGIFPDLWVNPRDSLDAVVRMCKYYGLIENKSDFKDRFIK
ncbi:MAG: hypothetical protein IKT67_07235 [Lachnospiraceae bacterium]|nr:hypothetical protein [Lachnospiraceae bacterium]